MAEFVLFYGLHCGLHILVAEYYVAPTHCNNLTFTGKGEIALVVIAQLRLRLFPLHVYISLHLLSGHSVIGNVRLQHVSACRNAIFPLHFYRWPKGPKGNINSERYKLQKVKHTLVRV